MGLRCLTVRVSDRESASLQHVIEGAVSPASGGLNIVGVKTAGGEPFLAGAAIFNHRSEPRVIPPPEHSAFMDRIECIDSDEAAS